MEDKAKKLLSDYIFQENQAIEAAADSSEIELAEKNIKIMKWILDKIE